MNKYKVIYTNRDGKKTYNIIEADDFRITQLGPILVIYNKNGPDSIYQLSSINTTVEVTQIRD